MTICLPVDGPAVILNGERFSDQVQVLGTPTYGRFLFLEHGGAFLSCAFLRGTTLSNIFGCRIIGCYFGVETQ